MARPSTKVEPAAEGAWRSQVEWSGPNTWEIKGRWTEYDAELAERKLLLGSEAGLETGQTSLVFLAEMDWAFHPLTRSVVAKASETGVVLVVRAVQPATANGPVARLVAGMPGVVVELDTWAQPRVLEGDVEVALRLRRDILWALGRLGWNAPHLVLLNPAMASLIGLMGGGKASVAILRSETVGGWSGEVGREVDRVVRAVGAGGALSGFPGATVDLAPLPGDPAAILDWIVAHASVAAPVLRGAPPMRLGDDDAVSVLSVDWLKSHEDRKVAMMATRRRLAGAARCLRLWLGRRHITARNIMHDLALCAYPGTVMYRRNLYRAACDVPTPDDIFVNGRSYWSARWRREMSTALGDHADALEAAGAELDAISPAGTFPQFKAQSLISAAEAAWRMDRFDLIQTWLPQGISVLRQAGLSSSVLQIDPAFKAEWVETYGV